MHPAVLVHSFNLGDVEDPEIYAAAPLMEFMNSEAGQWLKQRSTRQMTYTIDNSYQDFCIKCKVWAQLNEQDTILYKLIFQ